MFDKKYVRVESIALSKAFELAKEAGTLKGLRGLYSNLYLTNSALIKESGFARTLVEGGDYIKAGDEWCSIVSQEPVPFEQLGLEKEIENLVAVEDPVNTTFALLAHEYDVFLDRLYLFYFNHEKTHKVALCIYINVVKRTKEDDWKIMEEVARVVPQHGQIVHTENGRPIQGDGYCNFDTEVIRREATSYAPIVI